MQAWKEEKNLENRLKAKTSASKIAARGRSLDQNVTPSFFCRTRTEQSGFAGIELFPPPVTDFCQIIAI